MTPGNSQAEHTDFSPVAGRAVTDLALRQMRRGTLVVTGLMAGMSAVAVAAHRSTVKDQVDATALKAPAGNPAIRTMFGEPIALDEAGGFAVWRTGTALTVVLTVWALLAAPRITRGEEEAGRWDALLAGRVTVTAMVARHIDVLGAASLLAGTAAFPGLAAAGAAVGGAAVHSAGLALCGAQPAPDTGLLTALGNFAAHLLAQRTAQRPRVTHASPASLRSPSDPAGKHETHDEKHP